MEQPRNVKKVKRASSKGKSQYTGAWTAGEDAALLEGVDEHGLDFGRIKAEAGARLGYRKVRALYAHFKYAHPDKFGQLRAANPSKQNQHATWTKAENEALKRGAKSHGKDWENILETEKKVLGHRAVRALDSRYHRKLS